MLKEKISTMSLRFLIRRPCLLLLLGTPTLQIVVLFVPPPDFSVAQDFLLLPLPGAVDSEAAVGFDDAAEGHAGHLEEAGSVVSILTNESPFLIVKG
jgi:hypothetical protein